MGKPCGCDALQLPPVASCVVRSIIICSSFGCSSSSSMVTCTQQPKCTKSVLLQVADNLPVYGVCCYMDEMLHRPPSLLKAKYPDCNMPLSRYMVSAPRCYCFLTHYPFFSLHMKVRHLSHHMPLPCSIYTFCVLCNQQACCLSPAQWCTEALCLHADGYVFLYCVLSLCLSQHRSACSY